jgi:DNA-binding transcriptional LysR family regulator
LALLRAGLGIVPLPCYMAAGEPDVARVLTSEFDLSLDLWLLTHRDLRRTRSIRTLLKFLADAVKRHAKIFRGGS